MNVPYEAQTELIETVTKSLFMSRRAGEDDAYFFQVAAALSALLDNLHGKRAADWPTMGDNNIGNMASVYANTQRPLVGITPRDVTLDMTRGKKGRITNVDIDQEAQERKADHDEE